MTTNTISRNIGDVINSIPFISPRNVKGMIRRKVGTFVIDKMCKNSKALVVKKI